VSNLALHRVDHVSNLALHKVDTGTSNLAIHKVDTYGTIPPMVPVPTVPVLFAS
jgi:hypothetical protein